MITREKKMAGPTCLAASNRIWRSLCTGKRLRFAGLALGKLPVTVFDHDDGCVNQNANRQGQTAEGHDVGSDVEVVHRDEGGDYRDGQREDGDQRRTEMEQKDDDDNADDDRFLEQITLQRIDRRMNQPGAVVSGGHFDTGWQRRFDRQKLLLDAIDYAEGVHAVAHHDDAANRFAVPLPFGHAFTDVRPKGNRSQIFDEDGSAVLRGDGNGLKVAQGMQIAEAANHVFRSAHFK